MRLRQSRYRGGKRDKRGALRREHMNDDEQQNRDMSHQLTRTLLPSYSNQDFRHTFASYLVYMLHLAASSVSEGGNKLTCPYVAKMRRGYKIVSPKYTRFYYHTVSRIPQHVTYAVRYKTAGQSNVEITCILSCTKWYCKALCTHDTKQRTQDICDQQRVVGKRVYRPNINFRKHKTYRYDMLGRYITLDA